MRIMGISGKLGTGKTTLFHILRNTVKNAVRLGYGDLLKKEAASAFAFPLSWAYSPSGKCEVINTGGAFGTPCELMSVREILQWWGTEYRRAQNTDYWCNEMARRVEAVKAEGASLVVIDDVRFPDEAELVIGHHGIMVRLEPYPEWKPGPNADHASETSLDDYQRFTAIYRPAFGGLERVAEDILYGKLFAA